MRERVSDQLVIVLGALVILCSSCREDAGKLKQKNGASTSKAKFLSPEDLGIQKTILRVTPSSDEVAILRVSMNSKLRPLENVVYDQIYWSNGQEVSESVVIVPLSFYLGYPEPEIDGPQFPDRWKLRAGSYRSDIDHYEFLRSSWRDSESEVTGEITYTKDSEAKSEDLEYQFRMFVVGLEEAKMMHPELMVERDEGQTYWEAAFLLDPDDG